MTKKRLIKSQLRFLIYVYVLLILMSLLTVASYTWFSISRTPRVSDMYLFINTMSGLQISTDPAAEEWELQLDFRNMVDETAPLRPITWSERNQRFYAANYGVDGRLTSYDLWEPLNDDRHANKDNADGYYIKATFYARCDQAITVHLSPAVEVDKGIDGSGTYLIGMPIWDGQEVIHHNGGQGAECAVRVGIRVTHVDSNGEPDGTPPQFYIYEPNSDIHIDGTTGYIPTPSIDQTAHLVNEARLIRQTASTWTEAYPVQRDVVIRDLGEFVGEPELFELLPGEMVRMDLLIWLEGQDVDCTNQITEAQILASIQFDGKTAGQSGMKPIE